MFRIGEVAERTKLGVETIRYYEKIGAIAPPSRSENGYRAYTGDAVKRLSFIRRARELGFSLKDIRSLLTFADVLLGLTALWSRRSPAGTMTKFVRKLPT